jgi:hypothetical protein
VSTRVTFSLAGRTPFRIPCRDRRGFPPKFLDFRNSPSSINTPSNGEGTFPFLRSSIFRVLLSRNLAFSCRSKPLQRLSSRSSGKNIALCLFLYFFACLSYFSTSFATFVFSGFEFLGFGGSKMNSHLQPVLGVEDDAERF